MNNQLASVMEDAKKIFFVGIGGISMSSLALACKSLGYVVAGSDKVESDVTKKLNSSGIPVSIGHRSENVDGFEAVVFTGAISNDNPELSSARERGIPLIYRADLLGWLMLSYKCRIGVSGMHGKSTTTSMLAHVFITAGEDPTVMNGAETKELSGSCRFGSKNSFIFEACEYKDSFLDMFPTVAVILNIDIDHTDYFSGIDEICRSFEKFAEIPFGQEVLSPVLIACGDDEHVLKIAEASPHAVTFGIKNANCDYLAKNIIDKNGYFSFDIIKGGENAGHVRLNVPGLHNIYNALASFAASDFYGIDGKKICSALTGFEGTLRRFEYKGECEGASVYIDYAHHPTELDASIAAAKEMARGGKVIAIFEPHTYSRTAAHFDEFVKSLSEADTAILVDIYAAREINVSGVSSSAIADMIPGAVYAPSYESAASLARTMVGSDGIILVLGAGTVYKIADMLV